MRKFMSVFVATAIALASPVVMAADAQSIIKTALEKQAERWEGVDVYVIDQVANGFPNKTYMKRTTVEDDAGNSYPLFVPTSAGNAGKPQGMPESAGKSPWASMDPRVLEDSETGAGAGVDAQDMASSMNTFMRTARLVGTSEVDGHDAFHLQSDAMNIVEPMNGEEFRIDTMKLWNDKEHYVPLKMAMEGAISSGVESRPIVIETRMMDYRNVPDSSMYEPYRQMVRMSGMMNDEQKAQMAEAREQLAEFEKQLASMPASQRQMMESMMGSRMEQFRKMAGGGDMEFEMVVNEIRVNPEM